MAKAPPGPPADRVALYDALVASRPDIERKGASVPYTSVNGRMVSFLNRDGRLVLRLSPQDSAAVISKHGAKLHEAYGVVQRDFVELPDTVFLKAAEARKYFDHAHAYAATLKPKPTKKPAKAGKSG